jgi:hypothetical protein
MIKETVEIKNNNSLIMDSTSLVISVRVAQGEKSNIVIGYPGLPNVEKWFYLGDALLYETPTGRFDIRVIQQNIASVKFLVTQLSLIPSIAAAFSSIEPDNTKFSQVELEKITSPSFPLS